MINVSKKKDILLLIKSRQKRNSLGYTLLEVILVLSILAGSGFMLLIKLPHNLQNQYLDQAATQLLEELRDTRQAALAENTWYQVKFFYEERYYRILRQGVKVKDVSLGEGVVFVNRLPDLIFNASGTPSVGMTIVLSTTTGEQKKVVVAPVAGRIREE